MTMTEEKGNVEERVPAIIEDRQPRKLTLLKRLT